MSGEQAVCDYCGSLRPVSSMVEEGDGIYMCINEYNCAERRAAQEVES